MTTYTVTARYPRGDLTPRTGWLYFKPTTTIVGDGNIILPAPVTAHLVDGAISVQLVGTDDPAYSPAGWLWTVEENLVGGRDPWAFELTADADLSTCRVVPPDGM